MPKPRNKAKKTSQPLQLSKTETEAGLEWLHSLPEDQFRDRVMADLFRRMQAEGHIEAYENIHGRNDKGVDYLLSASSAFGSSIRGIQVKSKRITRSESGDALSAVRIAGECHAAMQHEFHFQGRRVRLEAIEVWSSSPMTQDAEQEFNPPFATYKIVVKKDRELLSLLEKFCPGILSKVPQLAVSKYIAATQHPCAKAMRILGCNLNPSVHFIEPYFSSDAPTSYRQLQDRNGVLKPRLLAKTSLSQVVGLNTHTVIIAPPLSGRSYLLEHIQFRLATEDYITLLLKPEDFPKGDLNLDSLIAAKLKFVTTKQVQELQKASPIVLLLDDIDKCAPETKEKLFAANPQSVRLVATGRSLLTPAGVSVYHMAGVDWDQVVRFLRTVDSKLAAGKPFVDRAKRFLERAFGSSGLPRNPFTIAVMLEECQQSVGKFSTPTMGRLIGRFIELQLGSHSDSAYVVDFETKREFLTRFSGHPLGPFSIKKFEKYIGRFIEAKGHPHSITDFSNDLLRCGVFHRVDDQVRWSHPVIREYFWVKNLVAKRQLGPIQKRLEGDFDTTLAALVGSQMENAGPLLEPLCSRLSGIKLPHFSEFLQSPELCDPLSKFISDSDEEQMLTDLEKNGLLSLPAGQSAASSEPVKEPDAVPQQSVSLTDTQKGALKAKLDVFVKQLAECRLHLAFNVAALVLNARDTSRLDKEKSVEAVVLGCQLLAQFTQDFVSAVYENSKKIQLLSDTLSISILCGVTDEALGDPHLVTIFRNRLKASKEQTKTLVYLDLLLACGEEEHARILAELKKASLGVVLAFYWRAAMLYFFRFHRDKDRASLRKLLADIRKMERHYAIPRLV